MIESPESSGRAQASELPGGQAVVARYIGPYDGLAEAWKQVNAWMAEHGVNGGAATWEHYVSDPSVTPPEKLETRIVWPIGG